MHKNMDSLEDGSLLTYLTYSLVLTAGLQGDSWEADRDV